MPQLCKHKAENGSYCVLVCVDECFGAKQLFSVHVLTDTMPSDVS